MLNRTAHSQSDQAKASDQPKEKPEGLLVFMPVTGCLCPFIIVLLGMDPLLLKIPFGPWTKLLSFGSPVIILVLICVAAIPAALPLIVLAGEKLKLIRKR